MADFCYDCTYQLGIDPRLNDLAWADEGDNIVYLIALCEGCGYVAEYDQAGKRVIDPNASEFSVRYTLAARDCYHWQVTDKDGASFASYRDQDEAYDCLRFHQTPRPNTPELNDRLMLTGGLADILGNH